MEVHKHIILKLFFLIILLVWNDNLFADGKLSIDTSYECNRQNQAFTAVNLKVAGIQGRHSVSNLLLLNKRYPYSIFLDSSNGLDNPLTPIRGSVGTKFISNSYKKNISYSEDKYNNKILFEDWENKNFNNWDDDFAQGDTHIDTLPVYSGNYAVKMESSNPGIFAHFFGDHPRLAGEMIMDVTVEEYHYLSPSFKFPSIGMKLWIMNCFESWNAGYKLAKGKSKPNTWAPYYMAISVYGNGQIYGNLTRADGLGGPGDLWHNYRQNVGSPVVLEPGKWNKIKFRLELNSFGNNDGVFQLWINDELKCNYSNLNYRGMYTKGGFNHLMMSMHANPSHPKKQWLSRDNFYMFSGEESKISAATPFIMISK